jgi:hypothetical protein
MNANAYGKKIQLVHYCVVAGNRVYPAAYHFYRCACGKNKPGHKTNLPDNKG